MIHEATKKSTTVSGFFPLESPTGQHEHPHRASLKCLSLCIGSSTCSPVSPKKSLISHHLTNSNHRTVGRPRSLLVSLKKDGSTIRDSRLSSSAEKNQWIHHVDDHNQQNQKTTLYVFYWISWVKKATSFCWNMNKSWNSNVNTKLLGRHIAAKQIERTHIPKAHLQNCMIFKKRVWQSHQTYLCPSMTIWLLHFNMRTEKQHIERNNFNRNYDTYTVY